MSVKFTTLNDNADPTFNQLLGINNGGEIAGYSGSGTPAAVHPNKGYTVKAPYAQGTYQNENFPGSQQTQVTGINNADRTVGFWADANGDNFGFVEHDGKFLNVVDPNAPKSAPGTPSVEQLLGINDHDKAVGFYTDAAGNNHGVTFDVAKNDFDAVNIKGFTSVTATGINNEGDVSGFVQNGAVTEGFVDDHGKVTLLAGPKGAVSVQALGLNNEHEVVGSFTDAAQNTHGFLYDMKSKGYQTIDDPNSKTMTVVNGLNDKGQLVGFYLDAAGNTDGMLVQLSGHHGS